MISVAWLPRLRRNWPLLVALTFALYSVLVLIYAAVTWQRMQQNANALIVADNMRRTALLGDIVTQLKTVAADHANLSEIHSFLVNRDLGMSPRYGLSASQAAISVNFIRHAEDFGTRWKIQPPYIAYYSEQGEAIAESVQGAGQERATSLFQVLPGVFLDIRQRTLSITEPVLYKGKRDGLVTTEFPLDIFFRAPLPPDVASGYQELLLTIDGKHVCDLGTEQSLDQSTLTRIVGLRDNQVSSIDGVLDYPNGSTAPERLLIVKANVPGVPLVSVSIIPESIVFGPFVSRHVLTGAGLLLLLLLLGSFKLNSVRNRAEQLESDIALAEMERTVTEQRNQELSKEIRQRELLEEALAESKERWELAVAGTNDGIWDWDVRTGSVFFSTRWKEMLGYDDADIKGNVEEWSKLLHPEDIDLVMETVQRHLRGETAFYLCPQRLRCKDGSYKWILDRGRAMFNANGEAIRMAGSHTDITEQRVAEACIEDRNAQLDTIFSLSPDGFIAFDADRRVKYANPAYFQMTGQNHAEIIGISEEAFSAALSVMCIPTANFCGIDEMRQAVLGEAGVQVSQFRYRIELAGNIPRILELKFRLANATTVSQILYVRDVTYEVEVDRMKSDFLAHAAHELRTPMASIFGFSELLLANEFDSETRKDLLQTIYKQTGWLIEIINELLDLARIESRRGKDFNVEALALDSIVDDVLRNMQIDQDRWPVVVDLPANLKLVMADDSKLRQALTNILSNAVKYSCDGGAITIGADTRADSGKEFVSITVSDKGIGMTPEQTARVCERFYRADGSGKIPGSGLGMSIVKEIIELLGGKIEITSALGKGTAVTLLLPAFG